MLFSPLRRAAEFLADLLYGTVLPDPGEADVLGWLTDPVVDVLGIDGLTGMIPGDEAIAATVTIFLGVAMIFLAVPWLGKILKILMVGKAQRMLVTAVDGRPAVAIGAGFAATMVTQSSSVTTSVMVPFAGAGTLTTKQIYPLTLGANVGTTFTALIAALAVTGDGARLALVMALVHLCFNLAGILVIFVIPPWPSSCTSSSPSRRAPAPPPLREPAPARTRPLSDGGTLRARERARPPSPWGRRPGPRRRQANHATAANRGPVTRPPADRRLTGRTGCRPAGPRGRSAPSRCPRRRRSPRPAKRTGRRPGGRPPRSAPPRCCGSGKCPCRPGSACR